MLTRRQATASAGRPQTATSASCGQRIRPWREKQTGVDEDQLTAVPPVGLDFTERLSRCPFVHSSFRNHGMFIVAGLRHMLHTRGPPCSLLWNPGVLSTMSLP